MSGKELGRDRAFPIQSCDIEVDYFALGLTKRELFAAMAMQGIIHNVDWARPDSHTAREAVNLADALLSELAKAEGGEL